MTDFVGYLVDAAREGLITLYEARGMLGLPESGRVTNARVPWWWADRETRWGGYR